MILFLEEMETINLYYGYIYIIVRINKQIAITENTWYINL